VDRNPVGPDDTAATGLPALTVPGPHGDVWQRVTEVAAVLGDRPALESAGQRLSYAGLVERVHALVAELRTAPADEGGPASSPRPVGILAEQSADSVAAFLAVMAAGHPAVLLDVVLPEERIALIAERAGVEVVLADDASLELAERLTGVKTVRGLLPAGAGSLAPSPAGLDTVASVIFTSGTTGVPKGVVYTNRTWLSEGVVLGEALRLGPGDRVPVVLPAAFAAGQAVVVAGLLAGATLCLRDPRITGLRDLASWLPEQRLTTLHCTPSLLRSIDEALSDEVVLGTLRMVTTCGEKVYGGDVTAFRRHMPATACFVNWAGSSETASLTFNELGPGAPVPEGVVPSGSGVALRELVLLDPDGRRVPQGSVGRLHVDSAYVSAGYWGDAEATAAVFSALPDGRTRFRTGDNARIGADGTVHLVGRADDAVKVRGYLVEPAEVEGVLRSLPDVADAVVRGRADGDSPARLVAWVVPEPCRRTPSPAELRGAAARLLPDYMVPRDVVLLAALPRSERGKVDVRALPDPPPRPAPTPPETATERLVERAWAPILRLDAVGRDESFTGLGGDSLAVEEMLARLTRELGVALTSGDLAEHPTLAQFAQLLDGVTEGRVADRVPTLVRLRTTGCEPPVFCFAGAGGEAAYFEALAAALGPDRPVYAFQARGFDTRALPDWTVRGAARRAVRLVEQLAPEGPVQLVGHSMGGLIALSAAHQLSARGRRVELLTLLDTYLPQHRSGRAMAAMGPAVEPATRRELWRTRLRVLGAGLVSLPPEERKDVFHQLGARVARFHRPTPWAGRSLVFLSAENTDDPAWWDRLLTGEHAVERVDCDHLALLKQPWVTGVVERVLAVTPSS
jgi:acyl-CoA synthetase (AMP-forming)/AMP-acid ligase II/thioesterase domain-containing protein/aryl carrier-like protein